MTDIFAPADAGARTVRLVPFNAAKASETLGDLPEPLRHEIAAAGFSGRPGETLHLLTAPEGAPRALYGIGEGASPFDAAGAPFSLGEGDWAIESLPDGWDPTQTAIAWALGGYQFTRYRAPQRAPARLHPPEGADRAEAERVAKAAYRTRDLVNTPAGDMGPEALEAAARNLAAAYGAAVGVITGEALLEQNYPMIHAVGRAAAEAPRLIELEWGEVDHPRIALVGKGVCFDSGGLDLKPSSAMRLMKKDMGGAANVLGLAQMIMDAGLPVRLHVLIPAVENAVSAGAFRPGDILNSRKGLTVEIDNTDAEGRLVLADALTKASEEKAELIVDMATLTGAARIALGPDVVPFYTDDDGAAEALARTGGQVDDPLWRMPLWRGYEPDLEGAVSDLSNTGETRFAGSIYAALFLKRFVEAPTWMHFDIFAWTPASKPGKPKGGEMQAARALYHWLAQRYGG